MLFMSWGTKSEMLTPKARGLVAPIHRVGVATFDGEDYATAMVAIGDCDPLETRVQSFRVEFCS